MTTDADNPYEPPTPAHLADSLPCPFYRVHLPALSVRECWRTAATPFGFVAALANKLLGTSPRTPVGVASPEESRVVPWDRLPPRARQQLGPLVQQAQQLGMRLAYCSQRPTIGPLQLVTAVLCNQEGTIAASLTHLRFWSANNSNEQVRWGFMSRTVDGQWLVTRLRRREIDPSPAVQLVAPKQGTMQQLLEIHRRRLREARCCVAFAHTTDLFQAMIRFERDEFVHHRQRGVVREMSADELDYALNALEQHAASQLPRSAVASSVRRLGWSLIVLGLLLSWWNVGMEVGRFYLPGSQLLLVLGLLLVVGGLIVNFFVRLQKGASGR